MIRPSSNSNEKEEEGDDEYSRQLRSWIQRIVVGLGLCPWAVKSLQKGRLGCVTCQGTQPSDVTTDLRLAMQALCRDDNVDPFTTTFEEFDAYVKTVWKQRQEQQQQQEKSSQGSTATPTTTEHDQITLVAFHPQFLRWRSLPKGVTVGSLVRAHRGTAGFQKSIDTFPATIVETSNPAFGLRKIKVQFHSNDKEEERQRPQYIPIDWCIFRGDDDDEDEDEEGDPLPDNIMHRAPFPTIHLIRDVDLASLRVRDVSRTKRRNAQRMMKLKWDGV
eukprot:scaffold6038_cov125-Amphora_coffeaeformis.AAC.2